MPGDYYALALAERAGVSKPAISLTSSAWRLVPVFLDTFSRCVLTLDLAVPSSHCLYLDSTTVDL